MVLRWNPLPQIKALGVLCLSHSPLASTEEVIRGEAAAVPKIRACHGRQLETHCLGQKDSLTPFSLSLSV